MPDILKITLDHAQWRLKSKSKRITLLGPELFDPNFTGAADCFLLPGVNCLTMRPYQLREAYDQGNSGDYAKLTIGGGLEVNTSGKWKPYEKYASAGSFYLCDDSVGEYIRTSSAVGLNRPIVLTFHAYAAGDKHKVLDFGYSSSTVDPTAAEIGFVLWSDGTLDLYKGGTYVDEIKNLSIQQNAVNRLVIWPCRRRELVMFMVGYEASTVGKGETTGTPIASNVARHTFEDIDEGETAPSITPNTKFFVRSGGGAAGSVLVQFQPLTFPTSATALSTTWTYGGTPPTAEDVLFEWSNTVFPSITSASVYGDPAYAGDTDVSLVDLRLTDNSGAFVPDGEANQVKVRTTMTGDGNYAPFVYGAVSQYEPVTTETDSSEEFDATPFFMRCDLEVPDEPFGAHASIELTLGLEEVTTTEGEEPEDPPTIEDTVRDLEEEVPGIRKQSFRPAKLETGDNPPFLDGILRRPRFKDAIELQLRRVIFDLQTSMRLLEKYEFQTRMPFDGIPLCMPWSEGISMVGLVLNEAGWDMERTRLSNLNYIVSEVPHESCSEWNTAAEIGENALQVLEKAFRLASDCVWGEHPGVNGPEFWFLSKEDHDADEPVITLYRDIETAGALNPGITDTIELAELLYSDFEEEILEAESCGVRATGIHARTGAILQSVATDEDAADPELAPSMRPDNWIGYPVDTGASSRTFRQQEDCDRCVEGLLPVATQQQKVGQFGANTILFYEKEGVMLPVWRMDKVTLDGLGEDEEKAISALTGSFVKEIGDDDRVDSFHDRRARYTTGAILGGGGTTIQEIQSARTARGFNQYIEDLKRAALVASGIAQVVRVTP